MAEAAIGANFQRLGSISNAHVGREFEAIVADVLRGRGYSVVSDFGVQLGHGGRTKVRRFDLGCRDPAVLVECKSHRWTVGGNNPSAKMTVWNESMYYFHLAPIFYKKWLCVLRDRHAINGRSLAQHYLGSFGHLVPEGVEILEFDLDLPGQVSVFRADSQEQF